MLWTRGEKEKKFQDLRWKWWGQKHHHNLDCDTKILVGMSCEECSILNLSQVKSILSQVKSALSQVKSTLSQGSKS